MRHPEAFLERVQRWQLGHRFGDDETSTGDIRDGSGVAQRLVEYDKVVECALDEGLEASGPVDLDNELVVDLVGRELELSEAHNECVQYECDLVDCARAGASGHLYIFPLD